jgi:hypothetical protein
VRQEHLYAVGSSLLGIFVIAVAFARRPIAHWEMVALTGTVVLVSGVAWFVRGYVARSRIE